MGAAYSRLLTRAIVPAVSAILLLAGERLHAQAGVTCEPVADRGSRLLGCYITARQSLGALPTDTALYWHLDSFPSLAAAEAARTDRGTAVTSLGTAWLFTIADSGWRAHAGHRVAVIGPLTLVQADSFAAVYMEGIFQPGMSTRVHRHPGVEAWYTLAGAQCLETPRGKIVQRAGDPGMMVPGGDPMMLVGIGDTIRRSLVLILQDAGKPRQMLAPDWTPRGLCQN
jgi:quercetin dioxygenase-like cupin family protein